jgi:hypothetical protein
MTNLTALMACVGIAAALSGCAALPNTVCPVVEHQSHLSQHVGPSRSEYGSNRIGVTARWQIGQAWAEITEGYNVSAKAPNWNIYGDTVGPRESTELRVGYAFQVRP